MQIVFLFLYDIELKTQNVTNVDMFLLACFTHQMTQENRIRPHFVCSSCNNYVVLCICGYYESYISGQSLYNNTIQTFIEKSV